MSDYEKDWARQLADSERGTWREELRSRYAPWFDQLEWGFQCLDGWQSIIVELTGEIAEIVGEPDKCPELRIVQVKEKLGTLRYYAWIGVPREHGEAVQFAISRAEGLSRTTCEVCSVPGKLVSSGGYYHVACRQHEDPRTFR